MQITFVGHAGVFFEANGVGLLCDPWIHGAAFNDSWFAYPVPVLPPSVVERVTHLWISHEHPDHLSVATVRGLPRHVEVLYQRHWSPLTAQFFRSLGFRVRLLPHNARTELGRDFSVRLFQVGHEDSSLAINAGGATVVNLNDSKPSHRLLRSMAQRVGPVDLLLDQFSVAGWPGDTDAARRVLRDHVQAIRPRALMPFASFVRFGHVENAYLNDRRIAVHDVAGEVVLYPGDSAPLGEARDLTADALSRYDEDERALPNQPLASHPPVPVADVRDAAARFEAGMRASYHRMLLERIPPVAFSLTDTNDRLVVDVGGRGAEPAATVELSSQAAHHTFTERWGLPTLLISGRFRLDGDPSAFNRLKQLGALHSNQFHTRGLLRDLASHRTPDLLRRGPTGLLDLARRAR